MQCGWNTPFPVMGTLSSPRCVDLNADGVLDVVIGAGNLEYTSCDQGVIAMDGKLGNILWAVSSTDQIVGSPSFVDIDQDGTQDVIIGGRSKNMMAINGKDGKVFWRYKLQSQGFDPKAYARFNFFNCQIIDDVNQDGVSDILAANGGNAKALPNSMVDRHPGTLMILDSKTGTILSIDTMPDGLENYCSPLLHKVNGKQYIIYGTGGETCGGNMYRVALDSLKSNSLKSSKKLAHSEYEGFIAPPSLVDLNLDGVEDIIFSSHDGKITAINGSDDLILWTRNMKDLECNNMLVPGNFNGDRIPDLFGFFTKGNWPENHGVQEFVLDGNNGEILHLDSAGDVGFSSPVVFQMDNDPEDEVLMQINFSSGKGKLDYENQKEQLIIYDFPRFNKIAVDSLLKFKNISTTPWIGDLDQNGKLDIITCYLKNTYKVDEVNGMFISRICTPWMATPVLWGAYMGNQGDCKIH